MATSLSEGSGTLYSYGKGIDKGDTIGDCERHGRPFDCVDGHPGLPGWVDHSEGDPSTSDGPSSDSDSATGDAAPVKMVSSDVNTSLPASQPKTKRTGRRKQEPVPYTTELQRRKQRAGDATTGSGKTAEATRRRHDRFAIAVDATVDGNNVRSSLAAIECEERQRAERTNRELKIILENQ
ncbi:unnamed protein product [Phytophthora lilii]|uniref:Unnamed protein product n=1 Tax=Phytophthora lilii TaxID=2077276 RepID=A0A9W6WSN4_9STRA|nr:unnamed protein product [Phytophthora lilii]